MSDPLAWDLGDLYSGPDDPSIDRDLQAAGQRAAAFATAYREQIGLPDGPPAAVLLAALRELEGLLEQADKPLLYAELLHAAKTDDSSHGALIARVREKRAAIGRHLLFFDREWASVSDQAAARLMAEPALRRYGHFLERKRGVLGHRLTDDEESVLECKRQTAREAFLRLFDETVAAQRFRPATHHEDKPLTLAEIRDKLSALDRGARRAAAEAMTAGFQRDARLLTFIVNTLLLDHGLECRLRGVPDPMAPRNFANEINDREVEALMTAVERRRTLVERYYLLKREMLGLEQLHEYDRSAPVALGSSTWTWLEARRMVEEAYAAFSPRAGSIVKEFFERGWIDSARRPGKSGGSFSSMTVPSLHPYVLANFGGRLRDVVTLAHELGHGLHQRLSASAGHLQADASLIIAETAAVFGEMLLLDRLLAGSAARELRLAWLTSQIEMAIDRVFRQVMLTRFERSLHRARAEQGELTAETINETWLAAHRELYGSAVAFDSAYGCWWPSIGNFMEEPFYGYAYAFGQLLALALMERHCQDRECFASRYLEILAAGGSASPRALVARLGIDLADFKIWEAGLDRIAEMVTKAERLAGGLAGLA
jgi:oligoendopeptidase F